MDPSLGIRRVSDHKIWQKIGCRGAIAQISWYLHLRYGLLFPAFLCVNIAGCTNSYKERHSAKTTLSVLKSGKAGCFVLVKANMNVLRKTSLEPYGCAVVCIMHGYDACLSIGIPQQSGLGVLP